MDQTTVILLTMLGTVLTALVSFVGWVLRGIAKGSLLTPREAAGMDRRDAAKDEQIKELNEQVRLLLSESVANQNAFLDALRRVVAEGAKE